jgi:predicted nucleic acid-binding protein
MIIADTNLLAYLVIPGDRTAESEAVLLKDPMWVAPLLWRSELRSVLQKYVQRGDITVTQAVSLFEQAAAILGGNEAEVETREVLELTTRARVSSYDCEYVALAIALGVPLVTADRALLKAFPECAISAQAFLGV